MATPVKLVIGIKAAGKLVTPGGTAAVAWQLQQNGQWIVVNAQHPYVDGSTVAIAIQNPTGGRTNLDNETLIMNRTTPVDPWPTPPPPTDLTTGWTFNTVKTQETNQWPPLYPS